MSWTQSGWVQVSSMEMLRWGSCDSREAPPHRISSSVIARDRAPTLTSAHRPTQTGCPLQVSGMSSTQAVAAVLLNKRLKLKFSHPSPSSSHISAPGVFRCVGPFSLQSHTPWITWMSGHGDHCNPWPLTLYSLPEGSALPLRLGSETPQCEHAGIITKMNPLLQKWFILLTRQGRVKGCVYGLPYCCFVRCAFHSVFSNS